jgi:prepilin-type processing-associated H-X9-DG protein
VVLFDGQDVSRWIGQDGREVQWKVENGVLEVVPKTGNIRTKDLFGDCHLHIEWATPAEVKGDSQGRGNSGVFLMARYEIQVLDSYNNITYADGHAGAMYGQYPPLVNASRPPGEWQTYDIFFIAPHFEGEQLASPAYVTVIHNGILVHHHQAFLGPTGHKVLAMYHTPHDPQGPIMLQDHGDAVRYRNIWVRPIGEYDQG